MNADRPALTFLGALWPDEPLPGSLVIWTKSKRGKKRSAWTASRDEAVAIAERSRHDQDVYFGLALQDRDAAIGIARRKKPGARLCHVRGFSETATAIPGLWMDVDIAAHVHREQRLPQDLSTALTLLQAVPYEPSLIVDSGFGIHAYWLFREPWVFESDEDRSAARRLVSQLQDAVRVEAARQGWILESTADLTRLLRLPGTLNHKDTQPREVAILRRQLERRYDPVDFAAILPEVPCDQVGAERFVAYDEGPPADLEAIISECAWLRHCRDDAAILSEPEWYAMLGIVGRCASLEADGRQLAHQWSAAYPGYIRAETDSKLDHALSAAGPRTCRYISYELGGVATSCGDCRHRNKVKSPIVLGNGRQPLSRSVRESSEPDESVSSDDEMNEAIEALGALNDDPEPEAVRCVLDRLARCLQGAEPLAIQMTREVAIRALKGKVSAPAKFVDAALLGAGRTPTQEPEADRSLEGGPPYRATEQGLAWLKPTREGEVPILLANFTARIVGEVARDNGAEVMRAFEIEARHRGRDHRFEISAGKFSTLSWAIEHLGAQAVVSAGMGTRDHLRAAIQHLSDAVETRTVYTHLGWRQIAGEWCYLHAGGAIGPLGTVPAVETDPPSQLRLFLLPDPSEVKEARTCVGGCLRILDLLPDEVTVPMLCAIWRSVLGPCDFSLHLAGQTGEGKSELAALAQQYFGPELDARHLPGSWSSTGNALEALAFAAKDALLVVDDFAPAGNSHDFQRQNLEAARLLRAQGNRSGRNRLRPDGELRPAMAPRGLVLSTGEDVPTAHSIRARMLVLEVPVGGMAWDALTDCQAAAREGQFARMMATFLRWIAGRYDRVRDLHSQRTAMLREQASASGSGHRRTPSIVAELAHGFEVFLVFAREIGALDQAEAQRLWHRSWTALGRAASAQTEHLVSADPVRRFQELMASAMITGRAHVAAEDGSEPENPGAWGWRQLNAGVGSYPRNEWQPLGQQVGWLCEGSLYLDPNASFQAAQGMATIDGLGISPRTLWKRLKERGLLVSTDESRARNTVRVTLQGVRREVLHLTSEALMPAKLSQPSQQAQEPVRKRDFGTVLWDGSGLAVEKPSQKTVPRSLTEPGLDDPSGSIGTVGTVFTRQASDLDASWREA